jgi:membrane protease YdiL (CAAX protease family)
MRGKWLLAVEREKEILILVTSPVLLFLQRQYAIEDWRWPIFHIVSVSYIFLTPLLFLKLAGVRWRDVGWRIGTWPFRRDVTVLMAVALFLLLSVLASLPAFQEYYLPRKPLNIRDFLFHVFINLGLYFFMWEFFFRGYLLFTLKGRFGASAVIVQALLFTFFHIGKPVLEVVLALPAGLYLGYIAYRCSSFLPAFVIHWMTGVTLLLLV